MSFHVGQKVVCVNADPPSDGVCPNLTKGAIYTIQRFCHLSAEVGIFLCETAPPPHFGYCVCYWPSRFRPIVERGIETGMAILRKAAQDAADRKNLIAPAKAREKTQ